MIFNQIYRKFFSETAELLPPSSKMKEYRHQYCPTSQLILLARTGQPRINSIAVGALIEKIERSQAQLHTIPEAITGGCIGKSKILVLMICYLIAIMLSMQLDES